MTITPSQIATVREAAGKATKGPWSSIPVKGHRFNYVKSKDGAFVASEVDYLEADHIANCDPQTIIALLDAYEELQIVKDSLTEAYLSGVHSERTRKKAIDAMVTTTEELGVAND